MKAEAFKPQQIAQRLKDERKRLGLTQTELADIGAVSRPTQYLYEHADRYPSVEYLSRLNAHGIDSVFILTGATSIHSERTGEVTVSLETLLEFQDENKAMKARIDSLTASLTEQEVLLESLIQEAARSLLQRQN